MRLRAFIQYKDGKVVYFCTVKPWETWIDGGKGNLYTRIRQTKNKTNKQEKMEEKKVTGVQGQESAPSAKPGSRWKEFLGGRNKDLNLDDDDAVGGYLEGEFGRLDKSDAVNKKMNSLISEDKRNAGLISGLFSGKNSDGGDFKLVDYLVDAYYEELKDAANSEDAIERINAKIAAEEKAAAEEAEKDGNIQENFKKMSDALTAAMQKTGADEATCQEVIDWLYGREEEPGLYARIPERTVNEDDFTKLIYAFKRDSELEKARTEGRNEGRNSRPGAAHRSSSMPTQTDLGGGGGGAAPAEEDANPTATRYRSMRPRMA